VVSSLSTGRRRRAAQKFSLRFLSSSGAGADGAQPSDVIAKSGFAVNNAAIMACLGSAVSALLSESARTSQMFKGPVFGSAVSALLTETRWFSAGGLLSTVTFDQVFDEVQTLLEAAPSGVEDSEIDPGLAAVWFDAASELRDWLQRPKTKLMGSFGGLAALSVWWMNLKVYDPAIADLLEVPLTLLAGLLLQLAFITWKSD
jgi:hypothetical protein